MYYPFIPVSCTAKSDLILANCFDGDLMIIQARRAHFVAYRLGTGEVPGSNPGKGEHFSVKISNWIIQI